MRRLLTLALLVAITFAMSSGAPSFMCNQCHVDAKPIPPQDIVIKGLPQYYVPGKAYKLTIEILDVNECTPAMMACGGFALEASAGKFRIVESQYTFISPAGFVTHTKAGSMLRKWTVEWIAPKKPVPVTFKVAVIAANGDGTPFGDYFGMKTVKLQPAKVQAKANPQQFLEVCKAVVNAFTAHSPAQAYLDTAFRYNSEYISLYAEALTTANIINKYLSESQMLAKKVKGLIEESAAGINVDACSAYSYVHRALLDLAVVKFELARLEKIVSAINDIPRGACNYQKASSILNAMLKATSKDELRKLEAEAQAYGGLVKVVRCFLAGEANALSSGYRAYKSYVSSQVASLQAQLNKYSVTLGNMCYK